jgi:predicted nucleic acid-binding protein
MKKKLFIDTNIWLRFLLADQKKQFEDCQKLFNLNEQGKIKIYTSTIVLLEIVFTLASFYQIKKAAIIADLKAILEARNLTLIEKTDFNKTLSLFEAYQTKLADCLIASQLPRDTLLCTYDQDFKKIKTLASLTPAEYLTS